MPESSKHTSTSKLHRDKAPDIAFGTVLRRHRMARGFTQEQLAWETKIERAFISELERGVKGPSLLTIFRLAEALGIEPGQMVKETNHELQRHARK